MRLILHIFRKDARHLYPEILIVVGLTIAFAWTAPVQWIYSLNGPFAISGDVTVFMAPILRVILPITWLMLITRLVHEESLVGDRQFWITRPYRWPTLLAAKLLFLAVFLYLPLFLMQCYLLRHASLSILVAFPDLVRYHLRLTALYLLPILAIASVTSTFAKQFLTILVSIAYIGLVTAAGSSLMSRRIVAPGFDIACLTFATLVLVAVVLLQYALRRTRLSRLLLAGLPILLLLVVLVAPARMLIERAFPAGQLSQPYSLAFDPDPLRRQPGSEQPLVVDRNIVISLPVQLKGLPSGIRLKGIGAALDVETGQGFRWASHYQLVNAELNADYPNPTVDVLMPLSVFDRIRSTPVNFHLNIVFVKFETGEAKTVPAQFPGFASPGNGICPVFSDGTITSCLYPLRLPAPIGLTAEVSDLPCLDPNRSPNRVGQSFVGSDEDYLAFDFDPVATSQVRLWKQQNRPNLPRPAYLCPGATVALLPQRIVSRERLAISQQEIVLGPYAKHLAQPNTTIVAPSPNR
jgi:hypothetical protein